MAKKVAEAEEEKTKKGSGCVVILAILIALGLALGTCVYLIKTNRFLNLGELLRPHIKDTPILCMMLPDLSDEGNPNLFDRESLNTRYTRYYNETLQLRERVAELEKNAGDYKALESKYEIVLKEVDNLTRTLEAKEEAEKIAAETKEEEKLTALVKVYETMEAADAAKILEGMGELNISLVVDICKAMKNAKFAELLAEFDTDFAAVLSERMSQ